MRYPREFFAVQLAFAQKMAALTHQPYEEVVLQKTAFYRIFGLDYSFDPRNPLWQDYLAGLRQNEMDTDWSYLFYLDHLDDIPEYNTPRWGCFSFEYWPEEQETIRLHFSGLLDASGYGPLTSLRKEARIAELRSMFAHIKETHPAARTVHGGSWVYNRREYTRLFPDAYSQSAQIDPNEGSLRFRGLWGQFLRYTNQMNEQVMATFMERVASLHNASDFWQCFPYRAMTVKAPIEVFYNFYGI